MGMRKATRENVCLCRAHWTKQSHERRRIGRGRGSAVRTWDIWLALVVLSSLGLHHILRALLHCHDIVLENNTHELLVLVHGRGPCFRTSLPWNTRAKQWIKGERNRLVRSTSITVLPLRVQWLEILSILVRVLLKLAQEHAHL